MQYRIQASKVPFFVETVVRIFGLLVRTWISLACLRYARTDFSKQVGASASPANAGASKEIIASPGEC